MEQVDQVSTMNQDWILRSCPRRGKIAPPSTTSNTNATAAAVHEGAFSMTWLQDQAKQALIMNHQYWILRRCLRRKATPPPATFPSTGEPVVQASCRRSQGAFSSRQVSWKWLIRRNRNDNVWMADNKNNVNSRLLYSIMFNVCTAVD